MSQFAVSVFETHNYKEWTLQEICLFTESLKYKKSKTFCLSFLKQKRLINFDDLSTKTEGALIIRNKTIAELE